MSVPLFFQDTHGQCLRAAIANAVDAIAGRDAAMDVLSKGDLAFVSLRDAHSWLQRSTRAFQLQPVESPFRCEVDTWMRSVLGSGSVFLVRLVGESASGGKVDHCVTVEATRDLVLDCVEENSMRARDGVLAMCLGDGVEITEVREIRKLVRQHERTTGKRRKKRNFRARVRVREEKKKKREEDELAREAKKRRVKRVTGSDGED